MANSQADRQDPKAAEAQPPFPEQKQAYPGEEAQMQPRPDYGENSYRGSGRLAGTAALITGADSGIGRAVALAFAREGADVLVSYLQEEADAQETARVVMEAGRKVVLVPGDIAQEAHCRQLVARAVQEFGHLDILVNNAAFQSTHEDLREFTAQEIERTFRTNVFAMFYLCQAALDHLPPGSAIVNTASIEAYEPKSMLAAYAATKAAIVNFTKSFASEAIKKGIRVNAVAPGPVWTPLIPATMPKESIKDFGKSTPMGRAGQPAELAPAYVFLASQDSRYITGEVIGVTGGKPIS